jgi:hypothetical protein
MFYKCTLFGVIGCGIGLLFSCSAAKQVQVINKPPVIITASVPAGSTHTDAFLEDLLKQYPQYFGDILMHRDDWNVQIIYTRIDRGTNGVPILENHYFNVNAASYFYPASTIKLPVCLLAMQKLSELQRLGIDRNTTMITDAAYSGQSAVYNDPTTPDGRPTIAHYIKKILMVSDNDAFNRLYEFLGQDYINTELHKKGYEDVQVLHRLNIFLSEEENRHTNPVQFIGTDGKMLYQQPMQYNTAKYVPRKDSIGKGFLRGDKVLNEPMSFSKKNRISLEDLHTIVLSLVFPEKVPAGQRFNIAEDDRRFLLKYMGQLPTESTYPPYGDDTATYWPAYCKFLLFGGEKGELPKSIRSFSKSGDAYGHMLETAYITDVQNGVEFFLSAVIYCNSDGILNDDKYDYDKTGRPFLQHLGKVIYDTEKKRERKNKPDLSAVQFTYDK